MKDSRLVRSREGGGGGGGHFHIASGMACGTVRVQFLTLKSAKGAIFRLPKVSCFLRNITFFN